MNHQFYFVSILVLAFVGLSQQACSSQFQREFLAKHNELRAKHGVPALTLASDISSWAQQWADNLASRNSLTHRKPNKYGENLYMMAGSTSQPGSAPVQSWYNEISKYNYFGREPSMSTFSQWGHFTQVIWKGSQRVGVGCATKGKSLYVVANYSPAGNSAGGYASNVPAKRR